MATFCLTQLVIVTLNIFLVVIFVVANKDFCGSVFETQLDHALAGHVMKTAVVVDEFECQIKCLENNSCKAFNVHRPGNSAKRLKCELNSKTRQMKPRDFQWRKGSTYYGSVQVSCIEVPHHPGYHGKHCHSHGHVCGPLGVEDKNTVPDARMTASTFHDNKYHPYYGRLNGNRGLGAWCTKTKTDRTDYLQVDMGTVHRVCAVATQGYRSGSVWTTSYKVHLSTDGVIWSAYKENNEEKVHEFPGNTDQHSIVKHSLSSDVKARFIRFYPVTHFNHPCLRIEIFVLK